MEDNVVFLVLLLLFIWNILLTFNVIMQADDIKSQRVFMKVCMAIMRQHEIDKEKEQTKNMERHEQGC